MSGHFVYEIDERKLRVKLQEIEVELKQDSWSNFESYYLSKNNPKNEGALKNFTVPISMNIVLPLVFGLIIIIVAVILFKFISIKNPPVQEPIQATNPIEARSTIDSTAIKLNLVIMARQRDSIEKAKIKLAAMLDSLASKRADSLKTLNNQTELQKTEKTALSNPNQNSIATASNNVLKDTPKPKKKKQRKSTSDIEQEKALEELAPNTPDENEASLKPN